MRKEKYYKLLFRAAAIWSWLVSIGTYVADSVDIAFFRDILPSVEPRIFLDMAVLPTFLFGFAFWWVSNDMAKNHAIIAVGAAGSILAFFIFVIRSLQGDIPYIFLSAAVVDLLLGILMLEFLLWKRRTQ